MAAAPMPVSLPLDLFPVEIRESIYEYYFTTNPAAADGQDLIHAMRPSSLYSELLYFFYERRATNLTNSGSIMGYGQTLTGFLELHPTTVGSLRNMNIRTWVYLTRFNHVLHQSLLVHLQSAVHVRSLDIAITRLPHKTRFLLLLLTQMLAPGNRNLRRFRLYFTPLHGNQIALRHARFLAVFAEWLLRMMYPPGSSFVWIERNSRTRPVTQPFGILLGRLRRSFMRGARSFRQQHEWSTEGLGNR